MTVFLYILLLPNFDDEPREFSSLTLLYTTKTRHKGGLVCKWRIE